MKRIVVLSPHPDDESIGCGGTLCTHLAAGDAVHIVFLTSGELGGHGRRPTTTASLREAEAADAAAILGGAGLEFWRVPDGKVRADASTIGRLSERLRSLRPALLYVTHDREMHPDHRAAARVARAAVRALPPSRRPEILMYEVWTPLQRLDHIVDITAQVERKRAAIRAHRSQCEVVGFDDAILGLNRYRGEMHCWPEGDYAEAFARMPP